MFTKPPILPMGLSSPHFHRHPLPQSLQYRQESYLMFMPAILEL